jgi:NAD(P)-dependent dehydrogenase (short-subunit alcohol dehydrogenase family)
MSVTLHEQTVVVTGAARGIGRSIATACARAGAMVVLVDRLADELAATARTLQDAGLRVDPRPCELTDEPGVRRLFAGIAADHGRIDGLVNNAGTTVYGGALDTSWPDLAEVLRIHLAPTLLCAQQAAERMLAAGRGRIVNMASAAAQAAVTRLFGYSMAKAAVISMTQHMAAEFGGRGVAVNALAPGPVLTEALRGNQNAAVQRLLRDGIPMDRFATPEEVALCAVFLVSDHAAYVNGHVLTVDGGLMSTRTRLDRLAH